MALTWWYPTKKNNISVHSVFLLVYVWVRQWGAWKLHPYNSNAYRYVFIFIIHFNFCQFSSVWNMCHKFCGHDRNVSCKGVKRLYGCWLFSRVVSWHLRFSLCSGVVTTKALIMVESLYYPLVLGSVEYLMPYASCLGWCGVLLCCASLSCSVLL